MRRILIACAAALAMAGLASAGDRLAEGFAHPPAAYRPWCYWWWINGHADKETITADLEAMKRLGFGGLLMFDSRGYWDDERHIVNPKPEIAFMSPEWQELVEFAIREAARLGLEFTMNMSSSGGKLDGPWEVGEDAPKRLVYKYCASSESAKVPVADLPYYHDIDVQEVWYTGPEVKVGGGWLNGGDGVYTMSASSGKRLDASGDNAVRTRVAPGTPGARRVTLRFGYTVLPGHEHDVDVLDPKAVAGHYMRFQGTLQERIPGLVGRGKTLTHLYSVSWEGTMPTWTGNFENEFLKYTGREIRPDLPLLAGFVEADAVATESFMRAYRRARNDMFRENFYGTLRDLSHERGIGLYTESGGPWQRKPAVFREADQLAFLAVNDMPQGEFWPTRHHLPSDPLTGPKARYHLRGAVSTAHTYGLPRVSVEGFTHMIRHWSVDPGFLKPLADQAFADGVNHFVWHTFTCSPKKFGVPGAEYFAGSHINRNVTWHKDLAPFIAYLTRCQWMLQQGLPVADYAVYAGDRPYQHWGRYRDKPYDSSKAKLPAGYTYDLINDDVLLARAMVKDKRIVLPDGMSYGALVLDPEFPDDPLKPAVLAKIESFRKVGLPVFAASEAGKVTEVSAPDAEGPYTFAHRRVGTTDIYFVEGDAPATMTFRASAPVVELWDPLTTKRWTAPTVRTADGRTQVALDLPSDGSMFVVFREAGGAVAQERGPLEGGVRSCATVLAGPWQVSFAYHPGIAAAPPEARTLPALVDWTTVDDLKYFAGTAVYRTKVTLSAEDAARATTLSLGKVPSGLASVKVNGVDCGMVWCTPWTAEVNGALRAGGNEIEIRYVNNWYNRLLGDCFLPPEKRVTRSTLRYWNEPRKKDPARPWNVQPTVYSGYSTSDPLQPSGLIGPVSLR